MVTESLKKRRFLMKKLALAIIAVLALASVAGCATQTPPMVTKG
jgi:hypothetical protein